VRRWSWESRDGGGLMASSWTRMAYCEDTGCKCIRPITEMRSRNVYSCRRKNLCSKSESQGYGLGHHAHSFYNPPAFMQGGDDCFLVLFVHVCSIVCCCLLVSAPCRSLYHYSRLAWVRGRQGDRDDAGAGRLCGMRYGPSWVRACESQPRGGICMQEVMQEIMRPHWAILVSALQEDC
jgi:hypothetical protein